MNIMEALLSGNNAASLSNAASRLGLGEDQIRALVQNVVPVLAKGVQRNSASGDGFAALARALEGGGHERYLDNAEALAGARTDGNKILGHVLGDKEVSRNLATRAAQQTGVDYGLVKQFLPMAAASLMGALSQQNRANPGQLAQNLPSARGGGANPLTSFLDSDGDGSVADDLLDMAAKFLR